MHTLLLALSLALSPAALHRAPAALHRRAPAPLLSEKAWGGELAAEAAAAISAVQRAMQLCQTLACDMAMVDAGSVDSSKQMDACDVTAGVSFIKPGDSTPVTAADFAIHTAPHTLP